MRSGELQVTVGGKVMVRQGVTSTCPEGAGWLRIPTSTGKVMICDVSGLLSDECGAVWPSVGSHLVPGWARWRPRAQTRPSPSWAWAWRASGRRPGTGACGSDRACAQTAPGQVRRNIINKTQIQL